MSIFAISLECLIHSGVFTTPQIWTDPSCIKVLSSLFWEINDCALILQANNAEIRGTSFVKITNMNGDGGGLNMTLLDNQKLSIISTCFGFCLAKGFGSTYSAWNQDYRNYAYEVNLEHVSHIFTPEKNGASGYVNSVIGGLITGKNLNSSNNKNPVSGMRIGGQIEGSSWSKLATFVKFCMIRNNTTPKYGTLDQIMMIGVGMVNWQDTSYAKFQNLVVQDNFAGGGDLLIMSTCGYWLITDALFQRNFPTIIKGVQVWDTKNIIVLENIVTDVSYSYSVSSSQNIQVQPNTKTHMYFHISDRCLDRTPLPRIRAANLLFRLFEIGVV